MLAIPFKNTNLENAMLKLSTIAKKNGTSIGEKTKNLHVACKPDSVLISGKPVSIIYLVPALQPGIHLPTLLETPTRGEQGEQPCRRSDPRPRFTWHFNPQGLSPPKLPLGGVRSYHTFSPFPPS
jgi:hypothetical protein